MSVRMGPVISFLTALASAGIAGTAASAALLSFNFTFDTPNFSKPELDPLESLFSSNGISSVTGTLSYDSNDAVFVTSNFTFSSNIDALFDQAPGELVFAPGGNLNQIRSWRVAIGGVDYILELTGLDETDLVHPNEWFGGRVPGFPDNVFELTAAGGGLTPSPVPAPAGLALLAGGLGLLGAVRRGKRRSRAVPAGM